MKRWTVAVVGGGQLARMLAEAASQLGVTLRALVADPQGAAAQVIPGALVGDHRELAALRAVSAGAHAVTVEHEFVDLAALAQLTAHCHPAPHALRFAQDKLAMRTRLAELGLPVPRFAPVRQAGELARFGEVAGWPLIVKTARGGYDGKGVRLANSPADVSQWLQGLSSGTLRVAGLGGDGGGALLAEEKVAFTRELAVLVARRPGGEARAWPVVESVQAGGVCSQVLAPAPGLSAQTAAQAEQLALEVAAQLDVVGVLAVELFAVEETGRLYINELAMRPHNSGHWTIEGARTSQFEQHLRAVLDLPLGDPSALHPAAVMVNVLGTGRGDPRANYHAAMEGFPSAKIHLYGKEDRPGRKLGHVTVVGENHQTALAEASCAVEILRGG